VRLGMTSAAAVPATTKQNNESKSGVNMPLASTDALATEPNFMLDR
jgi:hypothetical protein